MEQLKGKWKLFFCRTQCKKHISKHFLCRRKLKRNVVHTVYKAQLPRAVLVHGTHGRVQIESHGLAEVRWEEGQVRIHGILALEATGAEVRHRMIEVGFDGGLGARADVYGVL